MIYSALMLVSVLAAAVCLIAFVIAPYGRFDGRHHDHLIPSAPRSYRLAH